MSYRKRNGDRVLVNKKREDGHPVVLVIGLFVAISLWVVWLNAGSLWARAVVLSSVRTQAVQHPASKQQTSEQPPEAGRAETFAEVGQTGDSFGGLNALFTGIAGALVAWAGAMQLTTLRETRLEAKEERQHRHKQAFEALFFQLLALSSQVTERIEKPGAQNKSGSRGTVPSRRGTRALDAYAYEVFNAARDWNSPDGLLEDLVRTFLIKVYDSRPSQFGPYFRVLFQLFKHVADDTVLTEAEKVRYSNIARGQISEGAVLLLALNGATVTGQPFVPLIERFGLLEHMHRRYRIDLRDSLALAYRPRAFMGSRDRSRPGNEWVPTPLLARDHFDELEQERLLADLEEDLELGFNPDDLEPRD